MPASRDLIDDLCRRHAAAKAERSTLDSTWERIAELYRPERTGFTSQQTPGQDRIREVYDGEQMDAADELARSMDYMITPKGESWVAVKTEAEVEAEDDEDLAAAWGDALAEADPAAAATPPAVPVQTAVAQQRLNMVGLPQGQTTFTGGDDQGCCTHNKFPTVKGRTRGSC